MSNAEILITILLTLSWQTIVLVILFAFGSVPGVWYKTKVPLIQLKCAIVSFIFSIVAFICTAVFKNVSNPMIGLLLGYALVASIVLCLASFYKYKNAVQIVEIKLKKGEYKLKQKFDTIGNRRYIEHSWIDANGLLIYLPSPPIGDGDLLLFCRKLNETNQYVCESIYEPLKGIKMIFDKIMGFIAFLYVSFGPVGLILATQHPDDYYELYGFFNQYGIVYVFFLISSRLFKTPKSVNWFLKSMAIIFLLITILFPWLEM